jgi:hypothetical protein
MRKAPSHNNSVYSNKGSSRVLRSELMSRSQLNKNQKEKQEGQGSHSEKEMSMRNAGEDHSNPMARN